MTYCVFEPKTDTVFIKINHFSLFLFSVTTQIPLRLMGGNSEYEGLVQVYHDGEWGSICRDGFDVRDGIVLCRGLGYQYKAHYFDGRYGSDDNYLLENLGCQGNESSIDGCFPTWGDVGFCFGEVGIECIGKCCL